MTPKAPAPLKPRATGIREILRMLFTAADRRIRTEPEPDYGKTDPPNARDRALHQEYLHNKRRNEQIEKILRKRGLRLVYANKMERATDKARAAWQAKQGARTRKIRQLQTTAMIELIDLAPAQARDYVHQLRRELEGI